MSIEGFTKEPRLRRPYMSREKGVSSRTQDFDFSATICAIAQTRDRTAFKQLFAFFGPRLKSYFIKIGATHAVAEDMAQDALLTVWIKADRFNPDKASAAGWIFTIARNLYVDLKRRERRRPVADPCDSVEQPTAMESMLAAERDRQVQAALDAIPRDQGRVIHLAFFEDQTQAEIAVQLRLPIGTVKSRSRLAMNRLRGAIQSIR